MSALLTLSGAGKRYGRTQWVIRGVDLAVDAGAVVAVRGANGAGKSTLLRLAVGACRASEGTVHRVPDGVRWVPDRVGVTARMPALTYLQHMGRLQGLSGRDARRRGGELLERLQVVGGHRAAIGTLSKGNAQKVLLAQAVLTRPRVLVLDEPWSGLDAVAREVLAELVAEVAAAGGAALYTDHTGAADDVGPTATFRVVDGRLLRVPSAPATQRVRVVLSGAGVATDWSGCPGVTRAEPDDGRVRLDVRPGDVDAVLSRALAADWSVYRVEPQEHR